MYIIPDGILSLVQTTLVLLIIQFTVTSWGIH